jgi:hypothetical protein
MLRVFETRVVKNMRVSERGSKLGLEEIAQ